MAEQDMLAQIRALNPDFKDYDDTTLATTIAEQHPDYKPYLTKYLHPASADLAAQGAQTAQNAPAEFASEVAEKTPHQKLAENEALVNKQIEEISSPELRGGVKFAQGMMESPTNVALMGALPAAPIASRLAGAAFGALSGIDVVKEYPRLMQLYQSGDMDKFREELTTHGLGAILGGLGLLHAVRGGVPKMVPDTTAKAYTEALSKAPDVAEGAGPDTAEAAEAQKTAQQSVAEKQLVPEEPEETEGPPIVKTSSGKVIPNPPASEYSRAELEDAIRRTGGDPSDPQQVADLQASLYGVKRPVNVTSVGDVPVSESSETPHDYQIDLADNDPSKVAHEMQHIRVQEGQIPSVPEGPGANDQISGQVAQDLGGTGRWAPQPTPNLNRLAIPGEAKQAISDVADQIIRQGPTTLAAIQAAAMDHGMSVEDLQKLGPETVELAIKSTAGRGLVGSAAVRYRQVQDSYIANPTSANKNGAEIAQLALLRTVQASIDVSHNMAVALAAHNIKIPALEAALPAGISDLVFELQKKDAMTQEVKDMLLQTDLSDPLARQRLTTILNTKVDAATPKSFSVRSKIGFYYLNNILSALTTVAIKSSADLSMTALAPGLQTIGALAKGEGIKSAFAQGDARLFGQLASLNDALLAFGHAIKYGPQTFSRENPLGTGAWAQTVGAPVRVLGAINDAFHLFNVRGELYAEGARQHIESGGSLADLYAKAKAFADNPTQEALEKAELEARKNTLTAEPGNITKAVLNLRGLMPAGEQLAPVVSVPVNLVKSAYEMSPFGGVSQVIGAYRGKDVSTQSAGRATLGTLMFLWGVAQTMKGRMNGSGPTDLNTNRGVKSVGFQPDSMLLPDGNHLPLKFLGAAGLSLATAANIGEIIMEAPQTPGLEQAIKSAWVHMGRTVLGYPMLRGISDMVDLISGKNPKAADILAGNTASGFVPYSSFLASGARAIDPYQRKIDGFVDAVKARVPFWRQTLNPKLDPAGNPLPAPGSPTSRFAGAVSEGETTDSPSQQLAAVSGVGPNPTTISLKKNFPTLKLNDADAYRLEQLSTQLSGQYFDRLDRAPSNVLALRPEDMRKIIDGNRGAGKRMLMAEMALDGRLQQYMQAAQMAQANKGQLNPYLLSLAVPGADKAEDMMKRFGIANSGLPDGVSPDLAGQYNRELQIARSMLYGPYTGNRSEIGSLPYSSGRAILQQVEDRAVAAAKTATLAKAKSKAAASAAQ